MKLTGIDCQIPSRQIESEDILEMVRRYSAPHHNSDKLKELEVLIKKLLFKTGINSRYWRKENESPINLIVKSIENALKMSNLQKQDIDLVIYSSIDRGFAEPANASFICKAIGLNHVRNFDVVDACMGWATAVQLADSFLKTPSEINAVLLVNAEFPMDERGSVLPHNFTITNKKELKWKYASFTLGEAASACIFQRDSTADCKFEFIENAEEAASCTIALPNFEKYLLDSEELPEFPMLDFYANSASLLKQGINPAITVFQKLLSRLNYQPKIIFPHSVSHKIIQDAAAKAGVQSLICSTVSELGNLATASVPSSIKKALNENLIAANEKGIACIASAGMKFCAFEIHL